jgi:hypothetical protein
MPNNSSEHCCFQYLYCIFTVAPKTRASRYSVWLLAPRGRNSSPGRLKNFLHVVKTGSGAHSASYPIGTRGSFPGAKLSTHLQLVPRSIKRGSMHPLPHTCLWCNAYLVKHRDNFPFFFYLRLDHQISLSCPVVLTGLAQCQAGKCTVLRC